MYKSCFLFIFVLIAIAGCDSVPGTGNTGEPDVKKNAKPVPDNELAIIEMEDSEAYGEIKIELYSNIAPKTVARFKELSKSGFYNGVSFHRINRDVIQSGDPNSKDDDPSNDGQGKSDLPDLEPEFSDIKYEPGIVGAARGNEFNSANSQFFIMKSRQPGFDNRYTVFGKVVEGMNNVTTIAGAPRSGERPTYDIRIKQIRIEPRK